jgi:hypothetical protein
MATTMLLYVWMCTWISWHQLPTNGICALVTSKGHPGTCKQVATGQQRALL